MARPIEDYALIGDCHTAALLASDGSIDWLCLPRFDSASVFGALLGDEEHGMWRVAPAGAATSTTRAYRDDTFAVTTRWETERGAVDVIDVMPRGDRRADVIRRVRGVRGTVDMVEDLRIRFDYAAALPWMRQVGTEERPALLAVAGPDAIIVRGPQLVASDHRHLAHFTVAEGETVDIVLTWYPAYREPPPAIDVDRRLEEDHEWWRAWASACIEPGAYDDAVHRSLLVLRALTHEDTGGIVAAATTSLPERFGGSRNWDYRYVWLRDAALTLESLLLHGYDEEALEWRNWLLRAIAGDPGDVQIMYGLSGERRLMEYTLDVLPGYDGAAPVRIGNAAYAQVQTDVFGEVLVALDRARAAGVGEDRSSWSLQVALLGFVARTWRQADRGIWEIRGAERHFTHSRVMVWAAFDRGIRGAERYGLDAPVEEWRRIRAEIREEVERTGYRADLGWFVQHDATDEVDASLLQLPQVGFVRPDDPRMLRTVARIEETLLHHGLPLRYRTGSGVDGLDGEENPFLACAFWLVEQYARSGRVEDAVRLMDRLVGFANDVGLLSEQYDPVARRHAGNTPQALSHLALVRAADAIAKSRAGEDMDDR